MQPTVVRPMQPTDRSEVAELIRASIDAWCQARGDEPLFAEGPEITTVFFDVYEAIDPGCGIVAEDRTSRRLVGSCFYHPRATHVSLGIMTVHPDYCGRGVARSLLQHVIDFADADEKPLRLISSATNLDSFSLYDRAGFVVRALYQDMLIRVPDAGLDAIPPSDLPLREGRPGDAHAMALLEMDLVGIMREKDFDHILENRAGFWYVTVCPNGNGRLDGFMASSVHPGCNMIGPGVARNEEVAVALLAAELDRHRGRWPIVVVPVGCRRLVEQLYRWGARNCDLHVSQARGHWHEPEGILIPTFLPESA